jgi:hypothetical protein
MLVYNTEGHRPSVQVNATVACVWLGVESPEVSSSSEGCLPNASRPRRYAEEGASISIRRMRRIATARFEQVALRPQNDWAAHDPIHDGHLDHGGEYPLVHL